MIVPLDSVMSLEGGVSDRLLFRGGTPGIEYVTGLLSTCLRQFEYSSPASRPSLTKCAFAGIANLPAVRRAIFIRDVTVSDTTELLEYCGGILGR